jgi:polyphosphate kinase
VSENIRVQSIVGRYLEHSRIFYFQNAPPDQQIYLGSADLMRRNLYNRVEVVFPLIDPRLRMKAMRVLATCLRDTVNTWMMQPDGQFLHLEPGDRPIDSHHTFMLDSFGLDEVPV